MKYNDEIVGKQYEIREIAILNWIEHFTSDEEERKDMRMNLQCYLQQEVWEELEGMKLVDVRETDYQKRLNIIFSNVKKISLMLMDRSTPYINTSKENDNGESLDTLLTNILVCTDINEKRVEKEWRRANEGV